MQMMLRILAAADAAAAALPRQPLRHYRQPLRFAPRASDAICRR